MTSHTILVPSLPRPYKFALFPVGCLLDSQLNELSRCPLLPCTEEPMDHTAPIRLESQHTIGTTPATITKATRKLSLVPQEEEFVVADKNGKDLIFVVKEAHEGAAKEYENDVTKGVTLDGSGKPVKIDGISHSQTKLLAQCVYERKLVNGQQADVSFDLMAIRKWPSSLTKALWKSLAKLSGMATDEDEKENQEQDAKNTRRATTDTSA